MSKASLATIGRTVLISTRKGSGYLPDIPNPAQDYYLERKLGSSINAATPDNPSLDPEYFPKIRDQGELGSCVGHGVVAALEYHLLRRDKAKWSKGPLSPLHAYYRARERIGMIGVDSGAYIRDGVWGASKYGVSREKDMPYDVQKFTRPPTKKAQNYAKFHQAVGYYRCDEPGAAAEQTVTNILKALQAGLPVVFGFTCYDNLGQAYGNGVIPLPASTSKMDGGHCMCIYGADTRSRLFTGPNSWGSGWGGKGANGERGYFFLPFDYFLRGMADDAWAVDHE